MGDRKLTGFRWWRIGESRRQRRELRAKMIPPVSDAGATTTYWLEFDAYDDPAPNLLRRTVASGGRRWDEIWNVFHGRWNPTELIHRGEVKGWEGMPEEVTEAQAVRAAAELERRWRTRFARQGRPWPAGPTSERP